ncbi:hypothetical protein D3C84_743290 [compost metagenome]
MAVDGAGQVGLFVDAQQVFQRYQHQGRAGMSQVTDAGVDQAVRVRLYRVIVLKGLLQTLTLLLAEVAPVPFAGGVDKRQALVPVDVPGLQPAGQGRQVMGAGGGQGVIGPVEDGLEVAGALLLELQYAHAENRPLGEFFP